MEERILKDELKDSNWKPTKFELDKDQLSKGEKLLKDIIEPLEKDDMSGKDYEDFVKNLIGKDAGEEIEPGQLPNSEKVMPVDKKVEAVLNLGLKDLDLQDEKVPVTLASLPVQNLFPTQSQIGILDSLGFLAFQVGPEKQKQVVKSYLNGTPDLGGGKIITANKKFIIDGHHRWSGVYLLNPNAKIQSFDLTINVGDEEKLLSIMQLAIASTYGGLFMKPANSSSDIFNFEGSCEELIINVLCGEYGYNQKKGGELRNCLTFLDCLSGKEPNMQDYDDAKGKTEEEVKSMIKDKIEQYTETIQKMVKNAEGIKSKKKENGPPRIVMPQPKDTSIETGEEGGDLPTEVRDKLVSGELNFNIPKPVYFESSKWIKTFEQFRNKR